MLSGPFARIDLSALRDNLAVARRAAPRSRIWAVVKADAYGHGIAAVAAALSVADGLAVARVEEAARLRDLGVEQPILVLEGAVHADEAEVAVQLGLDLVVHEEAQLVLLERLRAPRPLRIWLKVDTGMHRLGLLPEQVPGLVQRLAVCPAAAPSLGMMTHLSDADDPDTQLTDRQCERLVYLAAGRFELSIGNSAGILAFPAARTAWVRPGIMLYGASPLTGLSAAALGLRPVMHLATRLIAVKSLRRGDAVGYGGTYVCPEDMRVGVAAIGYGDGYPRHAPTGTPVVVRDRRVPLIGRVSMDMISLDLRSTPDAATGDLVTLWGDDPPVEEVAAAAGTIAYELLCRMGATRVVREYLSD